MIPRDTSAAARGEYDVIVVGGGVQGIAVTLEAARRGLRPLLLERDDFGSRTSWNSLRIVHGGLRYLQALDLPRFFESVAERRWYMANFPDLVRPLPCLMPLHGQGMHRPSVLAAALAGNDLLSARRNRGVREDRALPPGRVLSVDETLRHFPAARRDGLRGGALWYDAMMPDAQRVLMAMLHWAVGQGATVLNYLDVEGLQVSAGRVAGVEARDRAERSRLAFRAPNVILCAGPWNAALARRLVDRPVQPEPMLLAFNVFLERAAGFDVAVAVTPPRPGGKAYFLYPADGGVLAGTHQSPWTGGPDAGPPSAALVESFLADLAAAIPGFDAGAAQVLRVFWGLLPARAAGTDLLTKRPVLSRHAAQGGAAGLYSVTAIKLTTARLEAERVLRMMCRDGGQPLPPARASVPPEVLHPPRGEAFRQLLATDAARLRAVARRLIETEAVIHLDDLILRRTDWGMRPAMAEAVVRVLEEDPAFAALPATAQD